MKFLTFAIFSLFFALPASAQVEAKSVAQSANCKPVKVDTLRQRTGDYAETLYEVTCQSTGAQKGTEKKIKVMCRGKMCKSLK